MPDRTLQETGGLHFTCSKCRVVVPARPLDIAREYSGSQRGRGLVCWKCAEALPVAERDRVGGPTKLTLESVFLGGEHLRVADGYPGTPPADAARSIGGSLRDIELAHGDAPRGTRIAPTEPGKRSAAPIYVVIAVLLTLLVCCGFPLMFQILGALQRRL